MFPHEPDDDDELFTMSPRSRTSSNTFLSKLSSKVRHPTRTDLTTLQQVSIHLIIVDYSPVYTNTFYFVRQKTHWSIRVVVYCTAKTLQNDDLMVVRCTAATV